MQKVLDKSKMMWYNDKAACAGLLSRSAPWHSESDKNEVKTMYAVIETGGKQYQVKEGDTLFIEKLEAEGEITFDKVIMVGTDAGVKVGAPYVDGASVKATLLKNGKGKKITVFTYKPKKSSKRKIGHRQPYSQVRIEAINA